MILVMISGLILMGLILLYLEFFVPGGVLGAVGGICLAGSILLLFARVESIWIRSVFLVGILCFFLCTVSLALFRIKKSGSKNTFCATAHQRGYQASQFDQSVVGKEGKVVTDLKPSGKIVVEGQWYQAVSEGRYISKGEVVVVLRGEGARFIVRKKGKMHESI